MKFDQRHVNSKFKILNFKLMLIFVLVPVFVNAQEANFELDRSSPRGAFLRSLVLPGWGHHYLDKTDWRRGQYHMAADAVMILSYVGIRVRNNQLENDLETFARAYAGIDLSGRNRELFLAVANFDNLDEYNDFQLISRNWDNLITDNADNRWNWIDDDDRFRFQDKRERIDNNKNQLPALVTLMVANRIISGISAFVNTRNQNQLIPEARLSYLNEFGEPGITASLRFGF